MISNLDTGFGFPWNDNELINKVYDRDNYKVITTGTSNGRALILFSGNGLYFPNTEEVFTDTVIKKDRYEFEKTGNNRVLHKAFGKIIYVRDIYKQWYINGINSEYDSIEKTILFLKALLEGYRIVTCGISAGGYMATVVGMEIGAEKILNISGQWFLEDDNLIYRTYATGKDVSELIAIPHDKIKRCSSNIFYFFPARCKADIQQYEYCKDDLDYIFAMNVDLHGALFRREIWPHLMSIDSEKLRKICMKHKDELIEPERIFDETVPLRYKLIYRSRHFVQMMKKRQILTT